MFSVSYEPKSENWISFTQDPHDLFVCHFFQTEIPQFLSNEECDHIISLAKESGLSMSIAGFDLAAYEGDLDQDMR